ncbi:MAG: DUF4404 family protein [Gammaproteobacteria bacterium]|nr:DUF4404 family protein [Gammaproteobacteria bacterium]MDE2250056.1 DUF4404 family protein [Gammaproteobacteria bacterium]
MSNESLHEALARLHAELQAAPQLDEESRRLLQAIAADVGRASQGGNPATGGTADLGHAPRLEALAVRFEAGYPALAARLRGIVDALGRIGL